MGISQGLNNQYGIVLTSSSFTSSQYTEAPGSLLKEGRIVYSVAATDVEIETKNKRHATRILTALVLIRVECVDNYWNMQIPVRVCG